MNIPSENDEISKINQLAYDATARLPLQMLKRMLAASVNDAKYDEKLVALGQDPEMLRKQFQHIVDTDDLKLLKKFKVKEEQDFFKQKIKEKETIIWLYDVDSWCAWPGSWTSETTTTEHYAVLTFYCDEKTDRVQPRLRVIQTVFHDSDWLYTNKEEQLELHLHEPKFNLTLYQLIALHPKLIERIALLLGGVNELIRAL